MMRNGLYTFVTAALLGAALTSCNSNDDAGAQAIEIPGITIEADADCCTAEEALQVYNFVQTVKIVPELTTVVDGKYQVFAYTHGGTFHTGYNAVYFVATKKSSGNYVKDFSHIAATDSMSTAASSTVMPTTTAREAATAWSSHNSARSTPFPTWESG